jgi:hypothetical protein
MDLSQSADRQAEAAELAKYFSKFSAALTRLDEELARWKNYEADYQALKTTLLDLPKETSHPVMVRDRRWSVADECLQMVQYRASASE